MKILETNDLVPGQLHIEVTETQLVRVTRSVLAELVEVSEMGVAIALDDFGTGYSSLSLLRDLPVQIVKIDRSFVASMHEDGYARSIVSGVIAICHEVGVEVVAEGVENTEQMSMLQGFGCESGQGYLFGRPARQMRPSNCTQLDRGSLATVGLAS